MSDFLANRERKLAEAVALRAHLTLEAPFLDVDRWDEEEVAVAQEGGAEWVIALRRERSSSLRATKLRQVKESGDRIRCDVCAFDFANVYGELGEDYIEVHHRIPLHVSGETVTELGDLALLCANCHRMIHRRGWMPIEVLKKIIVAGTV